MIIALLNQKGGVGKTTLATHLAGEFARKAQSVVLIDADPQGSALDWAQRRIKEATRLFGVVGLPRETLHLEAPELKASITSSSTDHLVLLRWPAPRCSPPTWCSFPSSRAPTISGQVSKCWRWSPKHGSSAKLQTAFVINRRVAGTVIGRGEMHEAVCIAVESWRHRHQFIVFAESVAVWLPSNWTMTATPHAKLLVGAEASSKAPSTRTHRHR